MRFIYKIFFVLIFSGIIGVEAFGIEDLKLQEKKVFTIDECVEYGINHDPDIKVAKDMIKVQSSRVGQAKSDYFPSLGAGTGYTFSSNKTDNQDSINNHTYGLNLSVNQLIWNFGKTSANINMQKYNKQSAEYDLAFDILVTTYKVKMAYYAVLAAKAYENVSERTVRINKLNYERTKALFDEGLKSKIDVVNSEVYYTDSQLQLIEAKHSYEAAVIDLANAMYYTDSPTFEIINTEDFDFKPVYYKPQETINYKKSDVKKSNNSEMVLTSGIEKVDIIKDFHFTPLDISVGDAIKKAQEDRPDLKSLELVLKASGESLKAIKRSYFPELGASAGYNLKKNDVNLNNSFQVYAGLDFPIINAMDIKYRVDEGKSYYNIAEENLDKARKNVYFEVQNTYLAMKQQEKRIPLMAQKVSQTLENFELADGRYTVGLGNYIELQDAQTNYNNAQLEFVQTVFKYNVAKEEFLKSMGVK